jgi:hypothetical protein
MNGSRIASLFLVLLLAGRCFPTSRVPMSRTQMIDSSMHILCGRVIKVESRWNDSRDDIYNLIKIAITEQLKGQALGEEIVLRLSGGTVDGQTAISNGEAEFEEGSEVIVCTHQVQAGYLNVLDGHSGTSIVKDGMLIDWGISLSEYRKMVADYLAEKATQNKP